MTGESWTQAKKDFLASSGNVLALGGPGSGKTHVALVKARDEIRSGSLLPGQKVLFLSFARPTVARILEKAKVLISPADLKHLEINTYHGFAWSVLRSHAYLLNAGKPVQLLAPPEGAALLSTIEPSARDTEKRRLFLEEGRLHFDLFASLVAELFGRSKSLAGIYADTFPIVVVDEFQDTDANEWAMVQALSVRSRIIALGDPDQRIYEFRGADPRRLADFIKALAPLPCTFEGENHRSNGTDIAAYGTDLLTGNNLGKTYGHVKVVPYGFYGKHSPHYSAKTELLRALKRARTAAEWSVAVLVPSKTLMLQVSEYLSSDTDGLPPIRHDVAMDAEPPALAATVIATVLEGGSVEELFLRLLAGLQTHMRGRNGAKAPTQLDLDLSGALGVFVGTGKVAGSRRKALVEECRKLVSARLSTEFTGDAGEDWLKVKALFAASTAPVLARVAEDAKYLRLLARGSALRTALSDLWKQQGGYTGAIAAVRVALVQEHFATSLKDWRGVHLMTIHKAKGKEFDEVVVYEGRHSGRIVPDDADTKRVEQSRLALRVAVTRAMKRATIVTPASARCPFV
jgi:DNA helicase-2/ATP-dependent DNA helicase PcrA